MSAKALGLAVGLVFTLLAESSCSGQSVQKSSPASEAAQAEPPPDSLKKDGLTYGDRQAWRKVLKWPQSCESLFGYPDKSFAGLRFFDLGRQSYLVQVTCELGAYQGTYVFFIWNEAELPPNAKLLRFTYYESSGNPASGRPSLRKRETTQLEGTPQFDPGTKQLEVVFKYRGRGDCGILYAYSFAPQTEARLVDTRAKLACDGKGPLSPKEWKEVIPG